ncbi:TQO small subunit DoxD [Mucilaginibacter glaciei]|uniref:DoxX family membrane protein n=1 Tax=Mucilaginibacter glaciei TaxID=2772109 RepID=A0A926NSY6_9SPHI|nr:TQO small subunit DoxD [Mucilaginibacter glaciei]MBD1394442.1 DoxX family membrane protein [Mucilaginibacter glaciei]
MRNTNIAYLLARMPIAMSMLGHGLVRIPKLVKFSAGIEKQFTNTMLPHALVYPYSIVLPFLELLTGILLILGLFTRFANILGVAIVLSLIFGSTMLEKWDAVFTQIIYGAYFALLYLFADHNRYSVDQLITGNKSNLV